jgi:hypothetical protein
MPEWLPFVVTLVVGLGGGAVMVEIIRTVRDKSKADLDLFYPTWKEEMSRLHQEVESLRAIVLALTDEVAKLGGDPIRVRTEAMRRVDNERGEK